MFNERNSIFLVFLCLYCSYSNAENIISKEELPPETFPKSAKEVFDFTQKNVLSNVTINVQTEHELTNDTSTTNSTVKVFRCLPNQGFGHVEIINNTQKILIFDKKITSKDAAAQCLFVMFYSNNEKFSSLAAPHFNALARAFPDIKVVATDVMLYPILYTQRGKGIPFLRLFHNSETVADYDGAEYTLELFSQFITQYTEIKAKEKSTVTSADFAGPLKIDSQEFDIYLILSWSFVIFCAIYYFMKSVWWTWILESIQNNWREAEAQAEHLHDD